MNDESARLRRRRPAVAVMAIYLRGYITQVEANDDVDDDAMSKSEFLCINNLDTRRIIINRQFSSVLCLV